MSEACFFNNETAIDAGTEDDGNSDDLTIRRSRVDGAASCDGFEVFGSNARITENVLLTTEGITIEHGIRK